MKKDQATRPDFFANFESLKRNQRAKEKGVTEEEQAYYAMSLSDGWKHFDKQKQLLLDEMDDFTSQSIARGLSREQIGENTIIVSMAKGVIKRLFDKVYDAAESVEQQV